MSTNTKIYRVTSLLEFDQIKKGKFSRANSLWFKHVIVQNESETPIKLSVAVSKKYGNAVARNLFKRRIKNAIYSYGQTHEIPNNILLLIGVDRECSNQIEYCEIYNSIEFFFKKVI